MAKLKNSARAKAAPEATETPSQSSSNSTAEQIKRTISGSAQHIWMAGVGAFNRAQEEGTRLFEALVKEGMNIESKTRKMAGGKVEAVREAVEERVGAVRGRAADTWDRLEKVFEERVQRALTRLGVPGRDEIAALIDRVDELNRELRKMSGVPEPVEVPAKKVRAKRAAKSAAKVPLTKAPAAKKTAARKPGAKKRNNGTAAA
jgi:poly(hydroxyalkanoate) granule-associated protein